MSLPATRDRFDRCQSCGGIRALDYRPLTRRQAEIYGYLIAEIGMHGYAPSFEEIAHHFDFSSLATVHEHLTNLEHKGWIRRGYSEARSIECLVRTDD
jgi:repressor LexA